MEEVQVLTTDAMCKEVWMYHSTQS